MEKIKINVIGSCVTREIFITANNENYKDIYVLGTDVWQTSIPCFMSAPVRGVDRPTCLTPFKAKSIHADVTKSGRKSVEEEKPDYIIFDLYADIRYGYAQVGNGFVTNNPSTFRKTNFYKEKKYTKILHSNSSEEHFKVFKTQFEKFINWKKTRLPKTKLILNRFRYASGYLENGVYKPFDKKEFPYVNNDLIQFERYEQYIMEKYKNDVAILDMTDRIAFGDPEHRAGKSPWHFTREHFERSMYLLNEIIIKDMLDSKLVQVEEKEYIN